MADDALLNDDDLFDDSSLLDDELLDDALLDDENISNKPAEMKNVDISSANTSNEDGQITGSPEKAYEPTTFSQSEEKLSGVDEISLDNEPLDYDDDLDDLAERRESKFTSERADSSKPTNINDILPQQKTAKSQSEEEMVSKPEAYRGRGGYRGRYNNRGAYRGRAGFRNAASFPFPSTPDQLGMFNNGAVGGYPNAMGMGGGLAIQSGSFGLPFNPNVPPPTLPSQLQAANWNRRVEAFVRKTAETGALPNRTRSYSGSSSCSTCSSSSRSRSRSPLPRRNDNRKDRRQRTPEKKKPVDDTKTARECAEAIGLDEEYLKKVEEQKRKREEIQRKKAEKFQDKEKTDEPETKRRRERSPVRSRERSADRDSRHRRKHHHHRRRHHSRGHHSSSLEKLAQIALESINQAVKPGHQPNSAMVPNNNMLPPMNVPPPPLPISSTASLPIATPSIPHQQIQPVQLPAIRTVSTALIGPPDQPQVIMQAPPPDAKEKKLKARLVVVVSNVRNLQNALNRIGLFAASVGDLKKVWQPTENDINIIFEKLDDAKKFLTQYHKRTISKIELMLSLHKMYLNLDTIS